LAGIAPPPCANALAVRGGSAAAAAVVAPAAADIVAAAEGAGAVPVGVGGGATAAAGAGAAADPPWSAAAVAASWGSSTSIPEAFSAGMADADVAPELRPYLRPTAFLAGGGGAGLSRGEGTAVRGGGVAAGAPAVGGGLVADPTVAVGEAAAAGSSPAAGLASDDMSIAEPAADAKNPVSGTTVAVPGQREGGGMATGAAEILV